ncbi:uncharacterized protein LOC129922662 isoform X2 [Biomphalaria glabrata]|nr:uncharacterized protein LOC129922662 isoform X2 [Biomphalaria glabrata]
MYMQNPDIFKGTICDSLFTRIKRRYLFGSLDDIENIDFDTNACTANDSLYKDNYKTTYTSKQDNLNINKETEEERTTYNIVYKDSPVTTILLVIITALLVMKFFGKKIMQRCSHNKKTGTNVEMTQSDEETAVGTRHEV